MTGEPAYPAPTLAEIFDELSETGNCFSRRGELGWMTMFEIPGDEEGYGYEIKTEHDKTNPATAALKLWLEVNKPDTPDRTNRKEEKTDETDENRGTEN